MLNNGIVLKKMCNILRANVKKWNKSREGEKKIESAPTLKRLTSTPTPHSSTYGIKNLLKLN